ncbi:MAG TPA: acetyl-CoA carboxylase biotin carboxyl carrier protein [candidate division Zixibacteria bacterium]|jgi:acetyl-CoA carboxylase biotin carboxyl carrier protein
MNVEKIRSLIRLVEESNIDSLEIRPFLRTAVRITKNRSAAHNGSSPGAPSQIDPMPTNPQPTAPTRLHTLADAPQSHLIPITSPMVGTFYRAPSPGTPAFVEAGQSIKPGDTLCIIEAMKLMNEIESEHSGRIVKVLVDNAQPVEFGQPLFLLDPTPVP